MLKDGLHLCITQSRIEGKRNSISENFLRLRIAVQPEVMMKRFEDRPIIGDPRFATGSKELPEP